MTKHFAESQVLCEINFDIAPREVVCILGSSGAGKSTLLRCVNHLERIDAGYLRVLGELVGYRRHGDKLHELREREIARQRSRIGMVFQSFNLLANMNILQNVTAGPTIVLGKDRKDAASEARELLARVGLADKASSYPRELSGGQQQRVAIARALAMKPELMLFDEPTLALDPELVGEVLQVMRSLAESGMTMIVVTHEIGFAREAADRILYMDAGSIVEDGQTSQVLNDPQQPRTAEFLSKVL